MLGFKLNHVSKRGHTGRMIKKQQCIEYPAQLISLWQIKIEIFPCFTWSLLNNNNRDFFPSLDAPRFVKWRISVHPVMRISSKENHSLLMTVMTDCALTTNAMELHSTKARYVGEILIWTDRPTSACWLPIPDQAINNRHADSTDIDVTRIIIHILCQGAHIAFLPLNKSCSRWCLVRGDANQ